jgi:transposase InsO family protein
VTADWLTWRQVMEFERISRRECFNRMRPADSHHLVWKPATVNGRPGRLIHAASMTQAAQRRWREHRMAQTVDAAITANPTAEGAQLSLLPRTKIDDQVAALSIKGSERDVVLRRFQIVQQCVNFSYKAEGFASKRDFVNSLAERNKTSARSIQRWVHDYRENENLECLARDARGPVRGEREGVINADAGAHLRSCWIVRFLTVRQCYDSLVEYLTGKQIAPALRVSHHYKIPSYPTVARYIRSLGPIDRAVRNGKAENLKAACGYIDRSYDDLSSGEMWCCDEWNVDAACYQDNDAREYYRPWIITLLDARSRFILSWCMTKKPRAENVLGLVESAVREYGRPDFFYSDKGGHFRGKLGRRFTEIDCEKMLGPAASILELLGVVRRGPGEEKNPRANPLERRHRIFADAARLLPTWCGPNTDERPDRFDQQWKMHEEWIRGKSPSTGLIPLSHIAEWFGRVVADYNHKPSGANGLNGLSPAAAYREFSTDADRRRRRLSEVEIALAFAEVFEQRTIQQGGVIELKDGMRYSHQSLLAIQGQKRDVKRSRHDRSFVFVLPASKSEEMIIARHRERVGHHDPEALARHTELLASARKSALASLPEMPPIAQVWGQPPLPLAIEQMMTSEELARAALELADIAPAKPVKELDFADLEP